MLQILDLICMQQFWTISDQYWYISTLKVDDKYVHNDKTVLQSKGKKNPSAQTSQWIQICIPPKTLHIYTHKHALCVPPFCCAAHQLKHSNSGAVFLFNSSSCRTQTCPHMHEQPPPLICAKCLWLNLCTPQPPNLYPEGPEPAEQSAE